MPDYVINPGQPHVLSLAEFIRPTYDIVSFTHPAFARMSVWSLKPAGPGREFGPFRIHFGYFSLNAEKNALRVEGSGIPIVAMCNGMKIGAMTATALWVHPEHRRKDLAIEMIVDQVRYAGIEEWKRFHYTREAAGLRMQYTREGLEVVRAAHAAMVERGLLVEEQATV
jgi:hypothetical protein